MRVTAAATIEPRRVWWRLGRLSRAHKRASPFFASAWSWKSPPRPWLPWANALPSASAGETVPGSGAWTFAYYGSDAPPSKPHDGCAFGEANGLPPA